MTPIAILCAAIVQIIRSASHLMTTHPLFKIHLEIIAVMTLGRTIIMRDLGEIIMIIVIESNHAVRLEILREILAENAIPNDIGVHLGKTFQTAARMETVTITIVAIVEIVTTVGIVEIESPVVLIIGLQTDINITIIAAHHPDRKSV